MNRQDLSNLGDQQEQGRQENPLAEQELLTPRDIEVLPRDEVQLDSTLNSLHLETSLDVPGIGQWDSGTQSNCDVGQSEGDTTMVADPPTSQRSQTGCDTDHGSNNETEEPRERLNFQFPRNQAMRPRSQASSESNYGMTDEEV